MKLRADDDVAKLQSLQATAELAEITYERDQQAAQDPGGQPGRRRHRRGQPEERQGAGRPAAGDRRQEDRARAVRRPSRHPRRRSRPISQRRHGDRDAAGARSDLSSISSCRSRRSTRSQIGQTVTVKVDAFQDQTFAGEISAINPKVDAASRNVQVRATLTKPGPQAAARHVRHRRHRRRRAAELHHAAADRDHLQPVRRHGLSSSTSKARTRTASRSSSRARPSSPPAPTRGDQVAVLNGVKEGDTVVTAGQIKLRNGSPVLINNASCRPTTPAPMPLDQ